MCPLLDPFHIGSDLLAQAQLICAQALKTFLFGFWLWQTKKVRLAAETASAAEDKRRGVDMIGKAEADIFLDEATAEAEEESLAAAAATDRTVTEAYLIL